jgi:hypothetical protein
MNPVLIEEPHTAAENNKGPKEINGNLGVMRNGFMG